MNKPKIQPCTDPAFGVHGHGADPDAHETTCARQILRAYDRPGAIALLDQQPIESLEFGETRSVIPLTSPLQRQIVRSDGVHWRDLQRCSKESTARVARI
jgi:hypothetical protein